MSAELIKQAAEALSGTTVLRHETRRHIARVVLDAVEPLIRADERRRALTEAEDVLRAASNDAQVDYIEVHRVHVLIVIGVGGIVVGLGMLVTSSPEARR